MLDLCCKADLGNLGQVALDGTKVKANASKYKVMSYGGMKKTVLELEAEDRQHWQRPKRLRRLKMRIMAKAIVATNLPKDGIWRKVVWKRSML